MIHYILCSRVSCVSGRELAKAIAEKQGHRCPCLVGREPRYPYIRHVRYGSLIHTTGDQLNDIDGVAVASDKHLSLQNMDNYGCSIPKIVPMDTISPVTSIGRVFRKNMRHGGNDNPYIVLANEECHVPRARTYDYCIEWIDKKREYRVHVFRGEVIRYQVKKKRRDRDRDTYNRDIRSYDNGWCLCHLEEPRDGLGELAIRAVEALGLDFGAADIVLGKNGNLYVLEVNTAPGLEPRGVAIYAEKIVEWDRTHPEDQQCQ